MKTLITLGLLSLLSISCYAIPSPDVMIKNTMETIMNHTSFHQPPTQSRKAPVQYIKIKPVYFGYYGPEGKERAAFDQCFRNVERYFPVSASAELRVKVHQTNNLAGDFRIKAYPHPWYRSFQFRGKSYPTGLARAIGLKRKSEVYPEVQLDVARKFSWYYGLDGRPRGHQYDLNTECTREMLHELMHPFLSFSTGYGKPQIPKYQPHRYLDFVAFRTTDNRYCALSSIAKDKHKYERAIQSGNLWFRTSKGRIAQLYAPPSYARDLSINSINPDSRSAGSDILKPRREPGKAYHGFSPTVVSMIKAMMNLAEKGAPVCPSSVSPSPYRHVPRRSVVASCSGGLLCS